MINYDIEVGKRVFCEQLGLEGLICGISKVSSNQSYIMDEDGCREEIPNYNGVFQVKVCFENYPRTHTFQYFKRSGEIESFADLFVDDSSNNGSLIAVLSGVGEKK